MENFEFEDKIVEILSEKLLVLPKIAGETTKGIQTSEKAEKMFAESKNLMVGMPLSATQNKGMNLFRARPQNVNAFFGHKLAMAHDLKRLCRDSVDQSALPADKSEERARTPLKFAVHIPMAQLDGKIYRICGYGELIEACARDIYAEYREQKLAALKKNHRGTGEATLNEELTQQTFLKFLNSFDAMGVQIEKSPMPVYFDKPGMYANTPYEIGNLSFFKFMVKTKVQRDAKQQVLQQVEEKKAFLEGRTLKKDGREAARSR